MKTMIYIGLFALSITVAALTLLSLMHSFGAFFGVVIFGISCMTIILWSIFLEMW